MPLVRKLASVMKSPHCWDCCLYPLPPWGNLWLDGVSIVCLLIFPPNMFVYVSVCVCVYVCNCVCVYLDKSVHSIKLNTDQLTMSTKV